MLNQDPSIDPTDPVALAVKALRLHEAYKSGGRIELAEQAVACFRASIAASPGDYPNRALLMSGAAICLQELFDGTGRVELLDEVEQLGRGALAITRAGDRFSAQRLTVLGNVLLARYDVNGQMEALLGAVEAYRKANDVSPVSPAVRAAGLTNLGNALHRLFGCSGEAAVLREAVEASRAAVAVTPAEHPDRARWQTNLVVVLRTLFERTGDIKALREAVDMGREAVEATPEDHAERAFRLSTLATALYRHAERVGDVTVLTEALSMGQDAVAATCEGHPRRASMLSDVGMMARLLYNHTGHLEALDQAVEACRAAVAAVPAGHPQRPDHLSNLGIALREMYECNGDQELLAEAVEAGRVSVEATPPDHPGRVTRATNLVVSLQRLFEDTGRSDLLLTAVAQARAAVEAAPDDLLARATVLGTLGNALRMMYERTGMEVALGEAARMLRAALGATPVGHPDRPGRLNDLAIALRLLAEHTGMQDGFAAAYTFLKEAADSVPADHRARLTILGNLAGVALKIFEFDRRQQIGERAVALFRAVALHTPENHADRGARLRNLGLALQTLAAEGEANAHLLAEARECFQTAANCASAPVLVSIRAGRELARLELAAGRAVAALEAIERVVELIDRVAPGSLVRSDREYQMALLAELPAQAAATALAAGRPEHAVELLERTRGVLVAETLGLRSGEQARLYAAHPDLARHLDQARNVLAALDQGFDAPSIAWEGSSASLTSTQRVAEQRAEAYAIVEEVLARVRVQPEFESFPHLDFKELALHAQAGPVVLINCDPARCDALILTGDTTKAVLHVSLPDLSYDTALEYSEWFARAQYATADRDLGPPEHADAEQEITHVLAWMWDVMAEPVLTALGHVSAPSQGAGEAASGSTSWPRLWWCPIGVAAALPLHAAGHHDDPASRCGGRRTVLDRVASSYTSTLLALRLPAAEDQTAELVGETPATPALIIAVPDTPRSPLPGAEREVSTLRTLLVNAHVMASPTRAQVLDALPRHRIAHFACHGRVDRLRPAQSHLVLADHATTPLTVADLVRLEFDADLAYLSACRTSVTAPQLADEALHLTGAFHLAGYRQVIGTLWPVDDHFAADLAIDVYTRLAHGASSHPNTPHAAQALHHAVRALRDKHPTRPALWAPYTHTGA